MKADFAPTGISLVARDTTSGAQLWAKPDEPGRSIYAAGFSADGRLLYLNRRGDLITVESRTGREVARWDMFAVGVAPKKGVSCWRVWASPDGRHLIGETYTGHLSVIDATTGALRWKLEVPASGPVAFAPDSRLVATVVGKDKTTVRIWDAATGAARQTIETDHRSITALAFDPTGTRLVTGGADGTGLVWRLEE